MAFSPSPARPAGAGGIAPLPEHPPVLAGNLLGVASMMTWAAAFPAADLLLQTWSPLALILARLMIAVAFLMPIWMLMDGPQAILRARWPQGLMVGGIGFGFGAYLILVAQDLTDPVTVALIASCAPLAGFMLEITSRRRKLTRRFVVGICASIFGGIIATNSSGLSHIGPGAGLAVLSVFLFSWGSDRAVRDFPDLSPIGRTTLTLTGALCMVTLICIGAFVLGFDTALSADPAPADLLPLLLYAIISMALSQALWIACVGRIGVALASFHLNVAPFYVMLIMLALGDGWDWNKAAGAALVGIGAIIAQSRPRSSKQTLPA